MRTIKTPSTNYTATKLPNETAIVNSSPATNGRARAAMKLRLDLQNVSSSREIPAQSLLKLWLQAALGGAALGTQRRQAEISLRIVDEAEMSELNGRYRGKPQPTNVLSFPADLPPEVKLPYLGDIVVCAAVLEREAQAQHKALPDHWAHMLIHGTLHLLGFDHIEPSEADAMESLEIAILKTLQIADPYDAAGPTTEDDLVNHG
jgi:probable rRNA maturation factor